MTSPKKNKRRGGPSRADYDEHLGRVEDKLEARAQRADAAFRKHTAGAKARLEKAEDKLEAAARKAENR